MTPHNEAKKGEIAKNVLMPGDPLRAKYIALNFLENAKLVNEVRNMYAYTGTYKGVPVTVMASGMGMPSMGIYSYELYNFYDVENIIRIGSAGAYTKDLDLYSLVLVSDSYSKSSFAKVQGYDKDIISSSKFINEKLKASAKDHGFKLTEGTVNSTDVFYSDEDINKLRDEKGCLCAEMESFALFYNAYKLKKNAACILTISDNLITKKETSADERQNAFNDMIIVALDAIISL